MDSGSALRCARNDSFDQSPNATNQRDRDPNPAASNKRCSLPVAPKHTSPQGQRRCRMAGTQIPPSITGLSASSNGPSARWQPILPAAPGKPIQSRQAKPVAPGIAKRHQLHPGRTLLPRTSTRRPRLTPQTHLTPRATRCRMADTQLPPSMTALSACPNAPSAH